MEPFWRRLREGCAKNIEQSRMGPTWWWYAWLDAQQARNLTPAKAPPHHCPLHRATGMKQKGAFRRPFGCLVYMPHPDKSDKVGPSAGNVECNNLGYRVPTATGITQECYTAWCPALGRIVRDVGKFVPYVFPGMQRSGGGSSKEPLISSAAKELVPNKEPYIDTDKLPSSSDEPILDFLPWNQMPTPITADGPPTAELTGHRLIDGEAHDAATRAQPQQPGPQLDPVVEQAGKRWRMHIGTIGATGNEYSEMSPDKTGTDMAGETIARRNAARKGNPYVRTALMAYVDKQFDETPMINERLDRLFSTEIESDSMDNTAFLNEVLEDPLTNAALAFNIAHEATEQGSRARRDLRCEYAAIMVVAATKGARLPPMDEMHVALEPSIVHKSTAGYTTGEGHTAREILADQMSGSIFINLDYVPGISELAMASKTKSDPDTLSERECWIAPDKKELEAAGWEEIANIKRANSFEGISPKDPRFKKYLEIGKKIIDVMMVGKRKRLEDGTIEKHKRRGVLRGDQMRGKDANLCFAPSPTCVEHMCCEAVAALRGMNEEPGDAVGAYLQGSLTKAEKPEDAEFIIARAPAGFREYDENDDEIYWLMRVPLYGQVDAGAIWHRTFDTHCIDEEKLCTIEQAPSLYAKCCGPNCTDRIHMPVHTDDLKIYSDPTPAAEAEHERLRKSLGTRFKMEWKYGVNPPSSMFTGKNVKRVSRTCRQVGVATYIRKQVPLTLPKPVESYPSSWRTMPADKEMQLAFDRAERQRVDPDPALVTSLRTFVGVWIFIVPYYPDIAYPINLAARAVPFVTQELMDHLLRVSVYLHYHADEPVTFSRATEGSNKLIGKSDNVCLYAFKRRLSVESTMCTSCDTESIRGSPHT